MKVLVFAKKKTTRDGRPFTSYNTKMKTKGGEERFHIIKFRNECGSPDPEDCPMYIDVEKKHANLRPEKYETTTEDGEVIEKERKVLWVAKWEKNPEEYVDTSLDEYED